VPNQNRLLPGGGGKPQERGQSSGSFGNGEGGVKLSSAGSVTQQFGGGILRFAVIFVVADSCGTAVVGLSPYTTVAIPSAMTALDGNRNTVSLPGIQLSSMTESVGSDKRAPGDSLIAADCCPRGPGFSGI
jgi:hypothetical protein